MWVLGIKQGFPLVRKEFYQLSCLLRCQYHLNRKKKKELLNKTRHFMENMRLFGKDNRSEVNIMLDKELESVFKMRTPC